MATQNSSVDQQYGRDTFLGMRLFDHPIRNPRTGAAPITAAVNTLVTAIAITLNSEQTHTLAAQPDVCRNVTMNLVDANTSISGITAVVRGLDYWGNPITERLTKAGGTGQVVGAMLFSQIDSIKTTATGSSAAGDTVAFGIGTKLGLPVRLGDSSDVKFKRETANQDTTGVIAINADGSASWLPANVPNGVRTYFVTVASTWGLP